MRVITQTTGHVKGGGEDALSAEGRVIPAPLTRALAAVSNRHARRMGDAPGRRCAVLRSGAV
jgi:hypothetical protein